MQVFKNNGVKPLKQIKMNCKQIHSNLIFYLEGELSSEKMQAVKFHLNDCDGCRHFAEMLKQQLQLIESEKQAEVSPYFFTKLSVRLDESYERPLLPVQGWLQTATLSLLLIVGIVIGIYFGNLPYSSVQKQTSDNNILLMNDFKAEPIETFLLEQQ